MAVNLFSNRASAPNTAEIQQLIAIYQQGNLSEARQVARGLTNKFPNHPFGWTILGAVHRAESDNTAALPCLKKVTELSPNDPNGHFNLANTLRDLGQRNEAIEHYRRALKLKPELPNGFFHLANLQHDSGFLSAAEKSFRQALKLNPTHVETLSNLAHLLQDMGQVQQAIELLDQALQHQPENALLHFNRSDALQEVGLFLDAEEAARTAIQLAPHWAQAHTRLADILTERGDLKNAVVAYEKAVELAPDSTDIHSSLLFVLNYLFPENQQGFLDLAQSYGLKTKEMTGEVSFKWLGDKSPTRLRVGLVSADLRNHPVGHFLEAVVKNLAPQRIELVAVNTQTFEDDLTQRVRPHFKEWHSIAGLTDADAAALICSLQLHVLLDLSGHTAGNRLPLFAHRLAPVQATWLGYFATTGVQEMDYLIADPITLPTDLENNFVESVWRLPDTRLCFTAPNETIKVNSLPALSNSGITFGSFSNLVKLNDEVIELWSRILHSLPTSRLLIQAKQLRAPEMREKIIALFAHHKVPRSQLILEAPTARKEYLSAYHRVDVCLDPFPFPGGTTTAEALWMGVPVLTLQGRNFLGMQGVGLLRNAGLADWVATSIEDYHARAVRIGEDLAALANLRQELRQQVLASPIFDAGKFAENLTAALWGMWEQRKPH